MNLESYDQKLHLKKIKEKIATISNAAERISIFIILSKNNNKKRTQVTRDNIIWKKYL